jgi:hypothetical protein
MQTDSLKITVENSKNTINLLGLSIDPVVFTVLTPIIILFIGYWLNKRNEKIKEKNKLLDIRLYFYSQVESLLESITKQKVNVDDFINKLREEKIQNLVFYLLPEFQIKHLLDLPKTDLFSVLVSKEKKTRIRRVSLFWDCQQSFDIVDWLSTNFPNRFGYIIAKCSEYEKRWNEAITYVGNYHDRWITESVKNKSNIQSDPFLNGFFEIYHQWAQEVAYRDMYVAENKLIMPLIQHCKNTLPISNAQLLLEELLKCKDAVDNHRNLRNNSIEEFGNYSKQLDKVSTDLTTAINELRATQNY